MRTLIVIGILLFALVTVVIPNYLGPDDLKHCSAPSTGKCEAADAIIAVSGGEEVICTVLVKYFDDGSFNLCLRCCHTVKFFLVMFLITIDLV